MAEPESIYAQLTRLLGARKDRVYDIEILPPGLGVLVHDGLSVGITKAALAQAFCVARKNFFSLSQGARTDLTQATQLEDREPDNNGQTSTDTEIILLFDAEHLTACNWRKWRLLRILEESPDDTVNAFLSEITFTTTLLRSPLHRHAKSPTLWHHRFWTVSQMLRENNSSSLNLLLSVLSSSQSQVRAGSGLETAQRVVQAELVVVLKAGEQHSMNYYAFSYMREFLSLVGSVLERSSASGHKDTTAEVHDDSQRSSSRQNRPSSPIHPLVTGRVLEDMHAWNLARPGDTSGWSFLAFLLGTAGDPTLQKSIVEKTVRFAVGIAWGGSPLWRFVDECGTRFDISLDGDLEPPDFVTGTRGASLARRWESWARWTKMCSRET